MPIKGTVFLYNNPSTKKLEVYTVNHGESPGTFTHNIRKTEADALNKKGLPQHDDMQFGHGQPVPAGTDDNPGVMVKQFPIGGTYNTGDSDQQGVWNWRYTAVPIEPGSWFRVGFRNRAWAVAEIPPEGEVVEIPYEEMKPQTNSSMGPYGQFAGWDVVPLDRDGSHIPAQLEGAIQDRDPTIVRGKARIVPIARPDDSQTLAGWEVWFENEARGKPAKGQTHGFTATVTLTNEQGEGAKNAGLGLESMACPAGGYRARQLIVAGGDYGQDKFGVRAEPGTKVRLGIRGHSSADTKLPSLADGEVSLDLKDFELSGADHQSDWFDGDDLMKKLGEKKARVDFFRGDARINDELPDTIYTGEEAFIRAEFKKPPRLLVERVADSAKYPGGGWRVRMKNELPDQDNLGPVGFSASLKVAHGDRLLADPASVPPARLSKDRREMEWFIPFGHNLAGVELEEGTELVIDSGPLAWRGTVKLPADGEKVDTSKDEPTLRELWVLRESDYHRALLTPREDV